MFYYLVLRNTPLGWYNVKDLNIKNLDKEQKVKGTYTVNQNNKGLYTIAWGTNQQRLDKTTLLIKLSQLLNRQLLMVKRIYTVQLIIKQVGLH